MSCWIIQPGRMCATALEQCSWYDQPWYRPVPMRRDSRAVAHRESPSVDMRRSAKRLWVSAVCRSVSNRPGSSLRIRYILTLTGGSSNMLGRCAGAVSGRKKHRLGDRTELSIDVRPDPGSVTLPAARQSGYRNGRQHGCVTQSEPRASASGSSGATPASVKPRAYAWSSDECRRKYHGRLIRSP